MSFISSNIRKLCKEKKKVYYSQVLEDIYTTRLEGEQRSGVLPVMGLR